MLIHFLSVNKKSQIAVAVLGALCGVALIAVIVLLIVRWRRRQPLTYQSETALVEHAELPDNNSLPENTTDLNRSTEMTQPHHHDFQDMVTYAGASRNDHQRF